MTAWNRKTWKFCWQLLRFFRKTTSYGKIFKILFRKFLPQHPSTLLYRYSNVAKCIRWEIGKIVRYLPNKNIISAASQTLATAWNAPKIRRGHPPSNMLTVLQISSKSVYFRRSNSQTRQHRFLLRSYATLRANKKLENIGSRIDMQTHAGFSSTRP